MQTKFKHEYEVVYKSIRSINLSKYKLYNGKIMTDTNE